MDKKENAVLTVVGKNEIGILAGVATAVAVHELECSIKERLPRVEVHLMHDNIFSAMHSI